MAHAYNVGRLRRAGTAERKGEGPAADGAHYKALGYAGPLKYAYRYGIYGDERDGGRLYHRNTGWPTPL